MSGHVLRIIRESAGLTRDQLAASVDVDPDTVKSWETGRRALSATTAQRVRRTRLVLQRAGADAAALAALWPALDADLIVHQVFTEDDPREWALAGLVGTRTLVDLVTWPATGQLPRALRHLPERRQWGLRAGERALFFDRLAGVSDDSTVPVLLRRQTYFMAGQDPHGRGVTHLRPPSDAADWPSRWVARRSLAVAQACQGDPTLLRSFLTQDMDDHGIRANLAYWSYWISPETDQADDEFLAEPRRLNRHALAELLDQLASGLHDANPYVDLSIRTVADILQQDGQVMDSTTAVDLARRAQRLLDTNVTDYPPSVQALDRIQFAANVRSTA